jgi:hypothetical protein
MDETKFLVCLTDAIISLVNSTSSCEATLEATFKFCENFMLAGKDGDVISLALKVSTPAPSYSMPASLLSSSSRHSWPVAEVRSNLADQVYIVKLLEAGHV